MTWRRHNDTTTHRRDAPIRHPGTPTQRRIDATMRRADFGTPHVHHARTTTHRCIDASARRRCVGAMTCQRDAPTWCVAGAACRRNNMTAQLHSCAVHWHASTTTRRQHRRDTPTQQCGTANRHPPPAPSLPHVPPPLPPTIRRHDIAATARRIDHVMTT
ncbi:hypothetical protein CTheo_9062 [Ceratobasidium theobromae]|uniref:Uncharacterized protein n=1 Tax=Ceratobasidium theobromae TaxID=1582974 RepID=A0A5N5Q6J8_9AGAM|nr:hypothetical protein CTheo_9062 [Ceratobasidium theobromae]